MQVIQPSGFWQRFRQMPLVGICRNVGLADMMQILPLYHSAGLLTIEITMNMPDAVDIIRKSVQEFGSALNIGAGTVCSIEDLNQAVGAGATFIVTPIVHEKMLQACRAAGIPIFAGALTPTEIFHAWNSGADVVKLFPASNVSAEYIKNIKGPFPGIPLLPTGGINLNNCAQFLTAGAVGVGIGSQLIDTKMVKEKDWQALKNHFSTYASTVSHVLDLKQKDFTQARTETYLYQGSLSTDRK